MDYKTKYLKYKNKYINLLLKGGLLENTQQKTNILYISLDLNKEDTKLLVEYASRPDICIIPETNRSIFCVHCTFLWVGKQSINLPTNVLPNHMVELTIDKLIVRKIDGASAYKVAQIKNITTNEIINKLDGVAHITAIIPKNKKPVISNEFVGLNDDSVIIHNINPFVITTTCVYKT